MTICKIFISLEPLTDSIRSRNNPNALDKFEEISDIIIF